MTNYVYKCETGDIIKGIPIVQKAMIEMSSESIKRQTRSRNGSSQ